MYGQRRKDPVEEQNDRIINEWIVPAFVAFCTAAFVYWLLSK
jgi:phosphate/sulfate permease